MRATRKPRLSAYWSCLPSFFGFGIDLDAEAGGAQLRGQREVVAAARGVEEAG